jgi:hypothetical protein
MRTIQSQVGTVILSLEAGRLYGEPIRICKLPEPERNGSLGTANEQRFIFERWPNR